METWIQIIVLTGAILYILRHLNRIMTGGEQGKKCHDCLQQIKKKPLKDEKVI